jgi:phosphoglycerol transferase MdoB-like AlkP superfamily enzyme
MRTAGVWYRAPTRAIMPSPPCNHSLSWHLISMILTLSIAAAIGVLWLAERSFATIAFATAALCFNAAILLLLVADLERAMLLSAILTAAIAGASHIKYKHSGLKLIVTDLPLLFAGTASFMVVQYPLAFSAVVLGAVAIVLAVVATVFGIAGASIAIEVRLLLFAIASFALAATHRSAGGAASFQRTVAQPRGYFSSFVASLLDPFSWNASGGLALIDIAGEQLPLMAAVAAGAPDRPDIIVIQHESIFDPRIYGLPVDPGVEAFLSPRHGRSGSLNVDIFGGGSWQSEFSLLTGLSSASFGSNAYFLFKRGVGRFKNTLPHVLAALGYRTTLMSSCRRNFLNYNEFYSAVGMDERIFTDDLPAPFDVDRFEATNSDAVFLEAAIGAHINSIARDAAPRFLYLLTNANHGPHNRRLVAPGQYESERAFAAASLPDAQYAEYYARLAETAAAWRRVKSELASRFPDRPMLIVHYGDHQPVMTRRIETRLRLATDPRRQFRTFYAIESLNDSSDRLVAGRGADLDIAFLGTVALQQAQLPLDEIFATRASLLAQCSDGYFASPSERKRRFHRTLVERGIIDLA